MSTPDLKEYRRRMDGALEALRKEFAGLRTGRASAALLEPVTVEAYGNSMPLNQVATVSVPEPRLITVQVWDKGVVKAVDRAIREAGLGVNPQTEGLKKAEKQHEISEDEHGRLSHEVQSMTDDHVKKVDETLAAKEKEIMQV